MNGFEEGIKDAIMQHGLFGRGDRVLIAVSGGLDSMVLLEVLQQLSRQYLPCTLAVAHFDHQLRGSESKRDYRFVQNAARALDLPFFGGRGDVLSLSRSNGISVEMAARNLRHKFLAQSARRFSAECIATAHHLDDQVEHFFIRMFRGAGLDSLSGMDWVGESPAEKHLRLIRPFLGVWREELQHYASERGLAFREDSSNLDCDIQRNRIRHELIPLLEKQYQPKLKRLVARTQTLLRAESAFLKAKESELTQSGEDETQFATLDLAMQRRLLKSRLIHLGIESSYELVELLRLQPTCAHSSGKEKFVMRDKQGTLNLLTSKDLNSWGTTQLSVTLTRPGVLTFSGTKLKWSYPRTVPDSMAGSAQVKAEGLEYFDADSIGNQIILRHPLPGDRYQPLGMSKQVKLKGMFNSAGINSLQRRKCIVATTESGTIFWVQGLRLGERFKISPNSTRVLKWKWEDSKDPKGGNLPV